MRTNSISVPRLNTARSTASSYSPSVPASSATASMWPYIFRSKSVFSSCSALAFQHGTAILVCSFMVKVWFYVWFFCCYVYHDSGSNGLPHIVLLKYLQLAILLHFLHHHLIRCTYHTAIYILPSAGQVLEFFVPKILTYAFHPIGCRIPDAHIQLSGFQNGRSPSWLLSNRSLSLLPAEAAACLGSLFSCTTSS